MQLKLSLLFSLFALNNAANLEVLSTLGQCSPLTYPIDCSGGLQTTNSSAYPYLDEDTCVARGCCYDADAEMKCTFQGEGKATVSERSE